MEIIIRVWSSALGAERLCQTIESVFHKKGIEFEDNGKTIKFAAMDLDGPASTVDGYVAFGATPMPEQLVPVKHFMAMLHEFNTNLLKNPEDRIYRMETIQYGDAVSGIRYAFYHDIGSMSDNDKCVPAFIAGDIPWSVIDVEDEHPEWYARAERAISYHYHHSLLNQGEMTNEPIQ